MCAGVGHALANARSHRPPNTHAHARTATTTAAATTTIVTPTTKYACGLCSAVSGRICGRGIGVVEPPGGGAATC